MIAGAVACWDEFVRFWNYRLLIQRRSLYLLLLKKNGRYNGKNRSQIGRPEGVRFEQQWLEQCSERDLKLIVDHYDNKLATLQARYKISKGGPTDQELSSYIVEGKRMNDEELALWMCSLSDSRIMRTEHKLRAVQEQQKKRAVENQRG